MTKPFLRLFSLSPNRPADFLNCFFPLTDDRNHFSNCLFLSTNRPSHFSMSFSDHPVVFDHHPMIRIISAIGFSNHPIVFSHQPITFYYHPIVKIISAIFISGDKKSHSGLKNNSEQNHFSYFPVCLLFSLISTRRIFPLMVFGNSSTNSIMRGYL